MVKFKLQGTKNKENHAEIYIPIWLNSNDYR